MAGSLRSPFLVWLLALGACSPPPTQVSGGPDDDDGTTAAMPSTGGDTPTTPPGTGPGTGGGDDSTTGPQTTLDSTSSPTTTGVDTGDSTGSTTEPGESSTTEPPPPECSMPEDCGNNQTCNAGQCESVCAAGWGLGTWNYCLDQWGGFDPDNACGGPFPDYACMWYGDPIVGVSCTTQSCNTVCDCPAPPPTGNATVTCAPLVPPEATDCYLSCENGETCPDGMFCHQNTVCLHAPANVPMYGNCGGLDSTCIAGQCASLQSGHNMCVETCGSVAECDPAPPGNAFPAECGGVLFPPEGPECYIPCNNDNDCAPGMSCISNTLCLWDP